MKHALTATAVVMLLTCAAYLGSQHIVHERDPDLKKVRYEIHYRGEPFTGLVYSHYQTNTLKRVMWLFDGKRVGTEKIWYPNGMVMMERPHQDGKPHGQWRQWYPDGKVKSQKTFAQGIIQGKVFGWHANGILSDFNLYDDQGHEIAHKSWISDGTPYYNYVYKDGKKVGMTGGQFCKRLGRKRK